MLQKMTQNRKTATKLLLVQWSRFQNVCIKLEGSTLFTGVNGTGKSTILDAMTYVLTGNTQFNKAAKDRETLVRPGKRAKVGASFDFGGILKATVTDVVEGGNRVVKFDYDTEKYKTVYEILDAVGNMPLPPYITKRLENKSDYQTVYAKEEGSAAAPTAGLHFTDELLERIKAKGVGYGEVTLHVGLGTFRPVKVDKIEEHLMHGEYFHITDEVAREINERRAKGGRIIAVGTTSARVLESVSTPDGKVHAIDGETSIFIYPGYKFKAVDALITNFHLPESTLIMLVSALAGKEFVMNAYEEAVREKYRFFSFGDAMLIV